MPSWSFFNYRQKSRLRHQSSRRIFTSVPFLFSWEMSPFGFSCYRSKCKLVSLSRRLLFVAIRFLFLTNVGVSLCVQMQGRERASKMNVLQILSYWYQDPIPGSMLSHYRNTCTLYKSPMAAPVPKYFNYVFWLPKRFELLFFLYILSE